MKNLLPALALGTLLALPALAQDATPTIATRRLPASVQVRTLEGKPVSAASLAEAAKGKPTVISFWATWCKPCIAELTNISEEYAEWQKESGMQLVAVSIDDARNAAKVAPLVRGKGWEYAVYLDQNQDLKRALNVTNVPHTFLLNGAGEIVWQHNAYQEGDEAHLRELVNKLAKGEPLGE